MHAVIRKYTAAPEVIAEARTKAADLEQTMRGTPGFAAYYVIDTGDGLTTITIIDDEAGATESMGRAATWVAQHMETRAAISAPEVTRGNTLISATR